MLADLDGVTASESADPASIYRGVSYHRASGKFQAYLGRRYLGLYPDQVTAAVVALQARQRHRYRFTEDPELEELADFLGPVAVNRRWSWSKRRTSKPPTERPTQTRSSSGMSSLCAANPDLP